jgi:hypothetical protein
VYVLGVVIFGGRKKRNNSPHAPTPWVIYTAEESAGTGRRAMMMMLLLMHACMLRIGFQRSGCLPFAGFVFFLIGEKNCLIYTLRESCDNY